jgi:tetratricopeptide (TPR) repeat protein
MVYWDRHYWKGKEFLSENFGDSLLLLTKVALSFNDQLSEAYALRGRYYSQIGKPEQAIEEYDKAIKLNPNDWMAYYGKAGFYYSTDLVNWINNLQKAASINRGTELLGLLTNLGWAYFCAGFPDKAKQYWLDRLNLDGDSSTYYYWLANYEFWLKNFNKSIEFAEKGYAIDSTNEDMLDILGKGNAWLGQYKESLKYYKKELEIMKNRRELFLNGMASIGYVYLQNGYKEEAENYFNEQLENCNRTIKLKRLWGQKLYEYYDLASTYAPIGEKDKAYLNLRILNQIQRTTLWMVTCMKADPLFNSIRNEPEFQQITKDIEAKYQTEHERVRKWLEANNML